MACAQSSWGSSPLTRGALRLELVVDHAGGLISAHAGSTRWGQWTVRRCGAHPRSRGEHAINVTVPLNPVGSSPLTRGALRCSVFLDLNAGLIPAHAGSTISSFPWSSPSRAHPRSRGEHYPLVYERFDGDGSSPLTRGAPHLHWLSLGTSRLIPAHAGSTSE